MSRLRWLSLLMGITILGITGFQLYWIRQNYSREEKSMEIKAEMAFRQTILKLQVSRLKLDTAMWNQKSGHGTGGGKVKIMLKEERGQDVDIRVIPRQGVVSTINVIQSKLKDSLKVRTDLKPGIVMMNREEISMPGDTMGFTRAMPGQGRPGDNIYSFLYDVDSLQDSLRLIEIDTAYQRTMTRLKMDIPFSILRSDSAGAGDLQRFNEVTIGFARPVTFRLQLGNTFPYLLKQIMQPILFSILLLGITILSFVLLYKNLLRQQKLAALKNEFISNITHELKTPIATVGVAIEALKNFNAMDDPKRTREYLDISQNELQRLSLLVDKVLKLSMFEKKELDLKFETVNLKEIVEEVVGSLRLQLEKNKASVSVTHDGDTGMQGDHLHLLSVIFNLLDNAVKYSRHAPSIGIGIKGNENNIVLSIADNGIGIAPEYKEKIFEKFFRVPHGDTHNAKGYGLGLSYVAEVVEKHKGSIALESQPGSGTKFIITLPKQQG
ncbi:MAG TPA: HAMP domain-containing sensor histidine kinase [Chitinophagaceae bacterium]|nr:HAMP domain-containing sensor histidine kinase [Chitinophagaceae bacterium]